MNTCKKYCFCKKCVAKWERDLAIDVERIKKENRERLAKMYDNLIK